MTDGPTRRPYDRRADRLYHVQTHTLYHHAPTYPTARAKPALRLHVHAHPLRVLPMRILLWHVHHAALPSAFAHLHAARSQRACACSRRQASTPHALLSLSPRHCHRTPLGPWPSPRCSALSGLTCRTFGRYGRPEALHRAAVAPFPLFSDALLVPVVQLPTRCCVRIRSLPSRSLARSLTTLVLLDPHAHVSQYPSRLRRRDTASCCLFFSFPCFTCPVFLFLLANPSVEPSLTAQRYVSVGYTPPVPMFLFLAAFQAAHPSVVVEPSTRTPALSSARAFLSFSDS
ncbi:hypothetical protein C8Q77DRAFT_400862 [Trametes polyzona]|nr:hypothetical protein C8Q77DRAFT_400862 [Trametes polyzona]